MTAQEKIDKILELTGLEFNDFAMKCEIVPNSLRQAVNRDKLTATIVTKIHDKFGVLKEFLKKGEGPVFPAGSDKKHTPVQISSDNKESRPTEKGDSITMLREVLEEGTEYRLIPKTILEGEYRIMPKKELDKYEKQFDKIDERTKLALDAKDEVIKMKEDLIKQRDELIQSLRLQISGMGTPGQ